MEIIIIDNEAILSDCFFSRGKMNKEYLKLLKNKYEKGIRIQFLDETCDSVPNGTRGVVDSVDQYGLIYVVSDDPTEMFLKDGKDSFQKLELGTLK